MEGIFPIVLNPPGSRLIPDLFIEKMIKYDIDGLLEKSAELILDPQQTNNKKVKRSLFDRFLDTFTPQLKKTPPKKFLDSQKKRKVSPSQNLKLKLSEVKNVIPVVKEKKTPPKMETPHIKSEDYQYEVFRPLRLSRVISNDVSNSGNTNTNNNNVPTSTSRRRKSITLKKRLSSLNLHNEFPKSVDSPSPNKPELSSPNSKDNSPSNLIQFKKVFSPL